MLVLLFNPLFAKPTKWSNTLKQFIGNVPTNCLNTFDYFAGLAIQFYEAKTIALFVMNNYFLFSSQYFRERNCTRTLSQLSDAK